MQALPYLGNLLKRSLPGKGELAMSLVPNLAYAGMTAVTLPGRQVDADGNVLYEGAGLGTRAGAFAEDAIGSLGVGLGARMLSRGTLGAIAKHRKKPFTPEREGFISNIAENVAEPAFYMTGLMPRPFANQAFQDYEQAMSTASRSDLQQQALEEQRREMEALQRYGGLAPAFDPVQQMLAQYGLG
jgi:hypothetical protein